MRILVATLSLFLLAAPLAYAKPTADESSAAREHYKRGTTLYDLGKYAEAIQEFQQAYEIKDDPVLLYNIAQSFRLSNQYQEALRFYKTYLRRAPKAPNRDEVETKIADMENLIQQQARVATMPSVDAIPPRGDRAANIGAKPSTNTPMARTEPRPEPRVQPRVEPTPDPEPRVEPRAEPEPKVEAKVEVKPEPAPDEQPAAKSGKGMLIAGIVVAVVGVALIGTGAAMVAIAKSDQSTVEKAPIFDAAVMTADAQGKSFGTIGPVLIGVGGAALAAGVIVAILGARPHGEAARVTVAPVLTPHAAGASLAFSF